MKDLDWPEKTKADADKLDRPLCRCGEVTFDIVGGGNDFTVFTTRRGHAVWLHLCGDRAGASAGGRDYHAGTAAGGGGLSANRRRQGQRDIDRLSTTREKTGVFTGAYAINPINGRKVPIWIADYVLATYGTGCVMAVPAHDERDYAFATKYDLPIERVIKAKDGERRRAALYRATGVLVNSGEFDGMTAKRRKQAIVDELAKSGQRRLQGQLPPARLADFPPALLGRAHPDDPLRALRRPCPCRRINLPVQLPYDVDFTPDGTSPAVKARRLYEHHLPRLRRAGQARCRIRWIPLCAPPGIICAIRIATMTEEAFDKDIDRRAAAGG